MATLYEKNLDWLKERCPAFFDWLEKSEEDPGVELIEVKPGIKDLRVTGKNRQRFLFYHTDDPLEHERELLQKNKFEENCVTFLVGLGLGYNLVAVAERMEKNHTVVVIESSATIVRHALEIQDLPSLIQEGFRLIFCPPDSQVIEQTAIKLMTGTIGFDAPEDVYILLHPSSDNISSEYNDFFKLLENQFYYSMVNLKTRTYCGKIFAINEIQNLPKIVSSPGIEHLSNCLPRVPAVVVSAGPSLYKNVHLLKEIQNKAIIIATAPVARVLLAYDVRPHLIGSMDYSKENYQPFEGICDLEEIPLVYLTRLYPQVVFDYQGDLIVVPQNGGIVNWLGKVWGTKGALPGCGNVGLFCLYIAAALGADPIILIGQDLAFTHRSSHTEGIMGRLKMETDKEKFIWVEGNLGEKVPVNSAFLTYIRQFKEAISSLKSVCINATEGGARIEGAVVMPLLEAIETHCSEPLDIDSTIQSALGSDRFGPVDYPALIQEIEGQIKTFQHIKTLCRKGLKLNRKIDRSVKKGEGIKDPEISRLIRKNCEISSEIQRFCDSFIIFQTYMGNEIFQINRRDYQSDPGQPGGDYDPDSLNKGIKRNRLILRESEKAILELTVEFKKSLNLIREYFQMQEKVSAAPHDLLLQYQWGKILLKMGFGKKARTAFLRSLELGKDDSDLLLSLADAYERCGQVSDARQVLHRFEKQDPANIEKVQMALSRLTEQEREWWNKAEAFWAEGDWINALLYSRKVSHSNPRAEEMINLAFKRREETVLKADRERSEWDREAAARTEYKDLFESGRKRFDEARFKEAAGLLEKAVALPYRETLEAQVLLACVYSELGEIGKTEALLREAMAKSPRSGLFHVNLGRAYLRNGHIPEGLKELEEAVKKESRFYEQHMDIGGVYFQLRNYQEAVHHFNQYLVHNPGSYEAFTKVGNCYLAQGRIEPARDCYEKALDLKSNYPAAKAGLSAIEEIRQRRL